MTTLEPLTQGILVSRTIETFPTGYLTLIAIIQGVALAILLQSAIPEIFGLHPYEHANHMLAAGQFAAGFVTVVVTSYMYMWFTTVMRWTPTVWDTLIPYVLSVAEIAPFFLLERYAQWWIAMAVLGVAGGGAFTHTLARSSKESFGDAPEAYDRSKRLLWGLIAFAAFWALGCASAAYMFSRIAQTTVIAVIAPWICLISGAAMMGYSDVILKAIYKDYGIERKLRTP